MKRETYMGREGDKAEGGRKESEETAKKEKRQQFNVKGNEVIQKQ